MSFGNLEDLILWIIRAFWVLNPSYARFGYLILISDPYQNSALCVKLEYEAKTIPKIVQAIKDNVKNPLKLEFKYLFTVNGILWWSYVFL